MDEGNRDMTERLQTEQREQGRQSEILDFDKYGGLYERFIAAGQAEKAEEIANIVNPEKPMERFMVRFKQTGNEIVLIDRKYNPVFQNSSLDERRDKWKDFKPTAEYPTAYSQWRTEFTGFMKKIEDPQRIRALTIILSDEDAKEFGKTSNFTADYADHLFDEFCRDGKSDIDKFIKQVTANLVVGKNINPEYLKDELNDLGWIASGLFGKETASNVVTRLIELESAIHNDPKEVLVALYKNFEKGRATPRPSNIPEDDEFGVLKRLYQSLVPSAERGPAQVATVTTSAPPAAVLKPDPFPESDEDEDEVGSPPSPPPPPATQERSGNTAERIQHLRSQLSTLEKSPTNISQHTKQYIEDQKKAINEQIKGLERIDELKIQIGNLEKIDTSKFGKHTIQNKSLQEEKLRKELADLEAKYAPPKKIVPKSEEEGLINAQPQPTERPVEEMSDQEIKKEKELILSKVPPEIRDKMFLDARKLNYQQSMDAYVEGDISYSGTVRKIWKFELANLRVAYREWEKSKNAEVSAVEAEDGSKLLLLDQLGNAGSEKERQNLIREQLLPLIAKANEAIRVTGNA